MRSSRLVYSTATENDTYLWDTDVRWRGTCRALHLRFVDGTEQVALFDFR